MVERARYCEYGNFEDQACRDRFIAGLVDETLQGKLNTNGYRDKDGNIVEFRTVASPWRLRAVELDRKSLPVKAKQHSFAKPKQWQRVV